MWPEDDPEKTELQWQVDFNKYHDTIDSKNPGRTILPSRSDHPSGRKEAKGRSDGSSDQDRSNQGSESSSSSAEHPGGTPSKRTRRAVRSLERLYADSVSPLGNRLDLGETIGTGGVGIVRQARQAALGRDVAVKTLRPHKRSQHNVADLLHEAWITGSLEHPNIVPVYDILLDDEGSPLIVLKRIEGTSWGQLIRDRKRVRDAFGADDLLEWNLAILIQVLNAVRFAHSRGVVHRDLKPENVMIGTFGEVYLVDWGLAVSLRDDETGRMPLAVNATSLAGTPAYMAPEMIGDSEVPITERTDIYLAGSILYEILCGRPPHLGKNAMAIIGSVVKSRPRFPDGVPDELTRICRRAMDPDPHGRFENAEQVRLALQGFLQHRESARLAHKAEHALAELEQELASDDTATSDGDPEHRQYLYKLFGACRFGFREALVTWSQNPAAHAGLERAIAGMVQYELAQGDARAAAALYAELPDPPERLRQQIASAQAAEHDGRRRAAELKNLGRQLDIDTGQRARAIATLVLGLVFTITPTFTTWLWPSLAYDSYTKIASWTAVFAVLTLAVGLRIRQSLHESVANRRIFTLLMFLILSSWPLQFGLWRAGVAPDEAMMVHEFVWFFIAAIIAFIFDMRLLPAAFAYLIVFGIMAMVPDSRMYIFNLPHAVLTVNYVLAWRTE